MKGNKHLCTLSLGGNFTNTKELFDLAIQLINKKIGKTTALSSLYSTKAWGMKKGTPDFYNQVVNIETELNPKKLLKKTQKIEKKLGRKTKSNNKEYSNRPIDIDILLYGNIIIEKKNLSIPHPLFHKRNFILIPLTELIPEYIHPVLKKSIKELLLLSEDKLEVKKYTKIACNKEWD